MCMSLDRTFSVQRGKDRAIGVLRSTNGMRRTRKRGVCNSEVLIAPCWLQWDRVCQACEINSAL